MAERAATPPRPWLQFSLRTALVLFVVVAIAVSLWVSYRQFHENERLRREIRSLRHLAGQLTIDDEEQDRIHAINIPTLDEYRWRMRVHVPHGGLFSLRLKCDQGVDRSHPLQAGQNVIAVALRRNREDRWEWIVDWNGPRGGGAIFEKCAIDRQPIEGFAIEETRSSKLWGQEQQTAKAGKEFELLQLTVLQVDYEAGLSMPQESVRVWIGDDRVAK